jgi:hypothetical protein
MKKMFEYGLKYDNAVVEENDQELLEIPKFEWNV